MITEHEARTRLKIQPWGSRLLVRFTETAEKTTGGIYLPDRMRTNTTEAEVLAVGPGHLAPLDRWPERWVSRELLPRFPLYVCVGDTVTFEWHVAQRIGEQQAVLDAEDVLAIVRSDGSLLPMSDWVLIKPDTGAQESKGGIRLADRVQRWRQRGTIQEYGPGRLQREGTCAFQRKSVHAIMNLPESVSLTGLVVYWEKKAKILQMGREVVEAWLIQAHELIACEERDDDAKDHDRDRREA